MSSQGELHAATPLSRRQLLRAVGAGALATGMLGSVSARVDAATKVGTGGQRSCIFILLCGAPSHLDTWDLKPNAPDEIRGPYQPIATTVPGMQICELAPKLARLGQYYSIIHSMTQGGAINNHFDAMHNCLAGVQKAPDNAPYIGSILAKYHPSQLNPITYAWLIKCVGDPVFCAPNIGNGGELGAGYSPMFIGSATNHPALPTFTGPELGPSDPQRLAERLGLLSSVERMAGRESGLPIHRDWDGVREKAVDLAMGPDFRKIYELHREPEALRQKYGMHPLGQNLLLARRLVEAGISFVTVNGWTGPAPGQGNGPPSSSWDMHGGQMGMGNAFGSGSYGMGWCLPRLDDALSALLTDLQDRRLLDSTLVVVVGEFGRTPKITNDNGIPGRAHWPDCYSAILAGGGIRGGDVYGESDKHAAYVKDKPVKPQDLGATIYHSLGVPRTVRGFDRPITTGHPLLDLFG